jgi:hypothetical protein
MSAATAVYVGVEIAELKKCKKLYVHPESVHNGGYMQLHNSAAAATCDLYARCPLAPVDKAGYGILLLDAAKLGTSFDVHTYRIQGPLQTTAVLAPLLALI